jgi:Antitoxin ParD
MDKLKKLSRITIDVPKEDHQKLKAIAALMGKSMRDVILESVQELLKNKSFELKDVR